ncbi:MAG: cation:proton antiporter [Cyanobacteria bacterium]|nr:cation:proton antiporter [Cyanobacteriota bacterium]
MLLSVLLALTVIMLTARLVGALFRQFDQPAVIGEVVGGILLGPSLLGRLSPELQAAILPSEIAPVISVIAQLGVILYMFLVGLELDLGALRGSVSKTMMIALAAIVVPFAFGAMLALALHNAISPDHVDRTSFVVFIGVALSITAFPVLARILEDRGLQRTPLGILALTCAAINDAIAWCLLAFAVSVMQATPSAAIRTAALTALYIGVMLTAGRALAKAAAARLDRSTHLGEQSVALVLVAVLLSSVATEFIGIHAIFGAFLIGTIIPHDSQVSMRVTERIADIVRVMFLPAFFAFTGLRTQIGLIQSGEDWALCALIIVVATAGKFGGTAVAARLTGTDWRTSAALGALMNTRGLVELIVLNIGLDLGVLTPRLFTTLVIMALATTMMTSPMLTRLLRSHHI